MDSLGSDVSTADLQSVIRYVEAMNTILRLYDTPAGKPAIEALLNKLAQSGTSSIFANLETMQESARELKVLQVAGRVEGAEAMKNLIDDFSAGGGKMKKAIYKLSQKLRSMHGSASATEKDKIRKVMNLLKEHSNKDIPNQVMEASLKPFMAKGKLLPNFDGQLISQVLAVTDREYEDDNEDPPGADVITRASQIK